MIDGLKEALRCCREDDCEHCPLQPQICDELDVVMESVPAELLDMIEEALKQNDTLSKC